MKRLSVSIAGLLVGISIAPAAHAGPITVYDASLATPPGWYDGSGNPNGGFTIVDNSGTELGLRVKYRQNPNVIDSPTNVYGVVAGPETAATSGGPSDATKGAWNYELSINLNPTNAASGFLTLSDIYANSTITIDNVTTGQTITESLFDISTPPVWAADDSLYGPSGKEAESPAGIATDWGAQNSENPVFGNFGIPYDMFAADSYEITANIIAQDGTLLNTDTVYASVNGAAVPEPASLLLLGTGAIGLAAKLRRRMRTRR